MVHRAKTPSIDALTTFRCAVQTVQGDFPDKTCGSERARRHRKPTIETVKTPDTVNNLSKIGVKECYVAQNILLYVSS